jgi:hypothetical protein
LSKLAAGNLASVAVDRSGKGSQTCGSVIVDMDLAQIDQKLGGERNVKSLKRQLLTAAIKKKDLKR